MTYIFNNENLLAIKIMTITIGSNIAALRSIKNLQKASNDISATYERLSSGQRINSAVDDAASLAIADALNTDARVIDQGIRNLKKILYRITAPSVFTEDTYA